MTSQFYIQNSAGLQHFVVTKKDDSNVVLQQNGYQKKFKILSQTGNQFALQDEKGCEFVVSTAQACHQGFAKLGQNSFAFEFYTEAAWRRQNAISQLTGDAACVMAPMPGRIVKIEVQEGEEVAVGQGLIVVEAMKMENEFKALKKGVVQKIHVQVGQAVEAKTLLMEIL